MTATHSSAQQARQALADRLRDLRADAGLTGHEHALRCGWNPAKTSRIERNKTAPSADDICTWCAVCRAEDQAADLIASLRAVEGMFVDWRRIVRDGQRQAQYSLAPLYERTKRFRVYSCWLIPGILQTPAYAERVFRAIQQRDDIVDDVDQALAARLERQRLLTEGTAVFAFLIEEHVLRTGAVDAGIMADQLQRLVEVAALPNLSVGIVPTRINRDRWPVEGYWMFDDAQVNVELVSGYLTVTQPREVQMYAKTFARLADLAVYGRDARALIRAAANSLSDATD